MTRFLTENEMEDIIDFIKPNKNIPTETANSIVRIAKEKLRSQLKKQQIYPEIIPELKKQLEKDYNESMIHPGESVGILAAQSIGEKNTQNTLNSIDWAEKIIYSKNNNMIVEPIGKMIDNLLLKFPDNIEKIEKNRTEYLKLCDDDYFIPSCDEEGNTGWYKIEAITKHLPVGKLVKVTTESGRTVIATQSKSFLVWNEDEQKFLATAGSDVKVGDILPTTQNLSRLNIKTQEFFDYKDVKINLDREFGFFIGLYLSGDYENLLCDVKIKDHFDKLKDCYKIDFDELLEYITVSGTNIPSFSYNSSDDHIKGLLSGFFRNCSYNNGSILCYSYYEDIINGIMFLLTYYGIFGFFTKCEDDLVYKLEIKEYNTEILEKNILEEIWKDIPDEFKLSNNKIENLEWCTNSENVNHSLNLKNVLQKSILQIDIKDKTIINKFSSFVEASNTLKICNSGIKACVYNKQKTSHGFICKYCDEENIQKFCVNFDKIINIEYINSKSKYVYDLTVEKTRNFQIFNGLNVRDTFHKAF